MPFSSRFVQDKLLKSKDSLCHLNAIFPFKKIEFLCCLLIAQNDMKERRGDWAPPNFLLPKSLEYELSYSTLSYPSFWTKFGLAAN